MKNRARRRPSDEVIGAGTSSKMDQPIAGDADYEPGSNELFAQIVDIFMKETRLDSVTHGLEGGRGAALVRDANGYIKEQIRRQRAKIFDKILKSRDAWQKKRSDPPFCRFIDKVSFTIGVACSLITSCLVGRSSLFMINWYTYLIMFLITLRLYLYRKEGYQYFLLDFCYFTTGLVFVYLYFYPNSQSLFVHIFAFANGPLAWAVPLWRNSLVFHDLGESNKLTSCAIHIFPMLLTFQLRWYPSNFSVCGPSWPVCEDIAISDIVVLPLLPYIIWQLAYTLKTQSKLFRLTKPVAIADDDLMVTSFKWLLSSSEGPVSMILRRFPTVAAQEAAFIALQFVYTWITLIPTVMFFHYMYTHMMFIVLIIGLAAWNGANFYVEIWTTRYKWTNHATLAHLSKSEGFRDTSSNESQSYCQKNKL